MTARRLRLCLILLACGAAVSACRRSSSPSSNSPGTVQGHVSGATNLTTSGLRVTLRRADTTGGGFAAETTLDKTGGFQIKGVPAGEYVVGSEVAGQGASVALTVLSQ